MRWHKRTEENFNDLHGTRTLPVLKGEPVKIKLPMDKVWSEPTEIVKRINDLLIWYEIELF